MAENEVRANMAEDEDHGLIPIEYRQNFVS